jgi:hypothetical protein
MKNSTAGAAVALPAGEQPDNITRLCDLIARHGTRSNGDLELELVFAAQTYCQPIPAWLNDDDYWRRLLFLCLESPRFGGRIRSALKCGH